MESGETAATVAAVDTTTTEAPREQPAAPPSSAPDQQQHPTTNSNEPVATDGVAPSSPAARTGAGLLYAVHIVFAIAVIAAFIILYANLSTYQKTTDIFPSRYTMYQDVHVMIFIGFGFLMCFLHRNGFTATSHAYLLAVAGVLWAILVRNFWKQAFNNTAASQWMVFSIGLADLINADFVVGAVLISMGAVIGRATSTQLLVMALFEVIIYGINEAILVYIYQIEDVGGSIVIHLFGGYFGLAVSFALSKRGEQQSTTQKSEVDNRSSDHSDTLAMVGTLFLFCFWPSFNAALAGPVTPAVQQRAVVNTLCSILSSTFVTFLLTNVLYNRKIRMVEIQNATLAGGVAMGASADMYTLPAGALVIGLGAGVLSVLGFKFIGPALDRTIGLKDTCGVHNLHAMPGLLGGLVSVIISRTMELSPADRATTEVFAARTYRSSYYQANNQLAAVATTLGIAIFSGLCVGVVLSMLPDLPKYYSDDVEFEVAEEDEKKKKKNN